MERRDGSAPHFTSLRNLARNVPSGATGAGLPSRLAVGEKPGAISEGIIHSDRAARGSAQPDPTEGHFPTIPPWVRV